MSRRSDPDKVGCSPVSTSTPRRRAVVRSTRGQCGRVRRRRCTGDQHCSRGEFFLALLALLAIGATGRHHQYGDHGSQGNRDSDEESERKKGIHAPIVGRRVFALRPATIT